MAEHYPKGLEGWRRCEDCFLTFHPDLTLHQSAPDLGVDVVPSIDLDPAHCDRWLARAPKSLIDFPKAKPPCRGNSQALSLAPSRTIQVVEVDR